MNTCKNCKHFDFHVIDQEGDWKGFGACNSPFLSQFYSHFNNGEYKLATRVLDTRGILVSCQRTFEVSDPALIVGENFGCIHWEDRYKADVDEIGEIIKGQRCFGCFGEPVSKIKSSHANMKTLFCHSCKKKFEIAPIYECQSCGETKNFKIDSFSGSPQKRFQCLNCNYMRLFE